MRRNETRARTMARWGAAEMKILGALPGTIDEIADRAHLARATVLKKLPDLMDAGDVSRPRRGYYVAEVTP